MWHGGRRCGYIPKLTNQQILAAIQSQQRVKCVLGTYRKSRKAIYESARYRRHRDQEDWDIGDDPELIQTFRPERADITITILNKKRVYDTIAGALELHQLGHPDIANGFESLGSYGIMLLERELETKNIPQKNEIMGKLYEYLKIPTKTEGLDLLL